jgi:2-oxo-4-hydroxy-4-carboxy-5-ureidoimidazoline decarboxylase
VVVAPLSLTEFNAAAESDAHGVLGSCLDIERWVLEVDAGRPYADWESLRATASASAGAITWDEVAGALARHPRIGERAGGDPGDVAPSALRLAKAISR